MSVGQDTISISRAKEILGEKRVICPSETSMVFGTKTPAFLPKVKYKEETLDSVERLNRRFHKQNDWYLCYLPKLSVNDLKLIFGSGGDSVFFQAGLQNVSDNEWQNKKFPPSFLLINFRGLFSGKKFTEQEFLANSMECKLTHPTIYLLGAILIHSNRELPKESEMYRYFYHRYRLESGKVVSVGIFENGSIDIQYRYSENFQFELLRTSVCL